MIGIVDYGSGNLNAIKNIFDRLDVRSIIVDSSTFIIPLH